MSTQISIERDLAKPGITVRNKLLACALLCATALFASACTTPTVRTDYDRKANLANYHTYSLEEIGNPRSGADRVFNNPLNEKRLRAAVETNLANKGLQPAAEGAPADSIVTISTGSREVVDSDPYPMRVGFGWGWWHRGFGTSFMYDDALYAYREHRVSIDLLDAKTRAPIWHVTADEDINRLSGSSAEARINEVVSKMFEKYPGTAPSK